MENKKSRYFGSYPFLNIFISKLIFFGIEYRRKQLLGEYKNNKQVVQLINDQKTGEEFIRYLEKGYNKVSIGGGAKNLEGFVNLDFFKHEVVEREVIANILDLSFIPDQSVQHFHSNHVMEHITPDQLDEQLKTYMDKLEKGGIISIRCPNALGVSYGFFFGQEEEVGHDDFLKLGYPKDEDFYDDRDGWYYQDLWGLYHWLYSYTGWLGTEHLNQLTPTKLTKAVEKAGFKILKMANPEASNLVLMAKKE